MSRTHLKGELFQSSFGQGMAMFCLTGMLLSCERPEELGSPSSVHYRELGLRCELSGSLSGAATVVLTNTSGAAITLVTNDTPFDDSANEPFRLHVDGMPQKYLGARYRKLSIRVTREISAQGQLEATFSVSDNFDVTADGFGELTLRKDDFTVLNAAGEEIPVPHGCASLAQQVQKHRPQPASAIGVRRDGIFFSGCSSSEISTIARFHNLALSVTSPARLGTQINSSSSHYRTWYGEWTAGRGAIVQAVNTDVNGWLNNSSRTYMCGAPGCFPSPPSTPPMAYVFGSCPSQTVCLCPGFFSFSDPTEQAATIPHEVSHLTSATGDAMQGPEACLAVAISDPAYAVINADNYGQFVANFNRWIRGDFAAQRNSSVGVWRPQGGPGESNGLWYINDWVTAATEWGGPDDLAVPGDYNGDRRTDRAIWRPSTGEWFVDDGVSAVVSWGGLGDIPVPCDYNGDGRTDPAIFRPSERTWYINDGVTGPTVWGESGDFLVPADYSGDGKCDMAVFRPSSGTWFINDGVTLPITRSGSIGAIPIPGDFQGLSRASPATWHPVTGAFTFEAPPLGAALAPTGGKANAPFNIPLVGRFLGSAVPGGTSIEAEVPAIYDPAIGTKIVRPTGVSSATSWGNATDTFTLLASPRGEARAWEAIPGLLPGGVAIVGSPAVSWWSPSAGQLRMDVFVRGSNNRLYQNTFTQNTWSGWAARGVALITSDPTAVSWGPGRIDVFARSATGSLTHFAWDPTSCANWCEDPLGGGLAPGSAPAASSTGFGHLAVFVRGTDDHLYVQRWNGSWEGWVPVGTGVIAGSPAAVSWSDTRTDVVARGTAGQLRHFAEDGNNWYEDEVGTNVSATFRPAITTLGWATLDVYAADNLDHMLLRKGYRPFSWSNWTESTANWLMRSGLGAIAHSAFGAPSIELFVRGPDGQVWRRSGAP